MPGASKTSSNPASQSVCRDTSIGLESHSKVPPYSRVGPLLQPLIFVVRFIGWRPASCVFYVCLASSGLILAFPVDKGACIWPFGHFPCFGKSSRCVRGSTGPGGEGAGARAPRSRAQARAPRPPSTASEKTRSGDSAQAHGCTGASCSSPRASLDGGVTDSSASKTTFRRPFCPGSGSRASFQAHVNI